MLNEKDLSKIFSIELSPIEISDIHWRSQDSDESSILFYKMGKDKPSQDLFVERIGQARFGWLITNQNHPQLPINALVVNEGLWPEVQKKILDFLYPQPSLKMIALTGTNGKTTTTDLVLQLGKIVGKDGISIGTLGVREYQKTILDFGLTSPGFIDLRKYLFRYGQGKDFCVLEASSHALVQQRLYGLQFDSAGWLSFSQDHLDYHHTMHSYFEAKCLLIQQLRSEAKLFVPAKQEELLLELSALSLKVTAAKSIKMNLPLFFQIQYNRNNLEVAQSIVEELFGNFPDIDYGDLYAPDGRFYIRPYGQSYIVVDFAHTPDALENICQGIRETFPHHSLKVLFGCGGDRDRTKRPKMAAVVEQWADMIYITSDNPRSEDPSRIIDDILKGIKKKQVKTIIERPIAVQIAFMEIKDNEILLLAGKGHEDYILINGIKHSYSDIRAVNEFLEGKT